MSKEATKEQLLATIEKLQIALSMSHQKASKLEGMAKLESDVLKKHGSFTSKRPSYKDMILAKAETYPQHPLLVEMGIT